MTKRVTNVGSHDGMVDITDLKSVAVRRPGSSPGGSTTLKSLHKIYLLTSVSVHLKIYQRPS